MNEEQVEQRFLRHRGHKKSCQLILLPLGKQKGLLQRTANDFVLEVSNKKEENTLQEEIKVKKKIVINRSQETLEYLKNIILKKDHFSERKVKK